jgi:rSAM/selenodomain-associated transferase 1
MNDKLVIIFIRNPELGKVKTRLARTIGEASALKIYTFLLDHTEKVVKDLDCDKALFYSENIDDNDIWDSGIYKKQLQHGKSLGERMYNAFSYAFRNDYRKAVIVGSDLYDLRPEHIEEAFDRLEDHDAVIGPALDGGYYLLGMNSLLPAVFYNKSWGSSAVLKDTLKDLSHIDVHLLEALNDIDTFDDLKNHSNLIRLIK